MLHEIFATFVGVLALAAGIAAILGLIFIPGWVASVIWLREDDETLLDAFEADKCASISFVIYIGIAALWWICLGCAQLGNWVLGKS